MNDRIEIQGSPYALLGLKEGAGKWSVAKAIRKLELADRRPIDQQLQDPQRLPVLMAMSALVDAESKNEYRRTGSFNDEALCIHLSKQAVLSIVPRNPFDKKPPPVVPCLVGWSKRIEDEGRLVTVQDEEMMSSVCFTDDGLGWCGADGPPIKVWRRRSFSEHKAISGMEKDENSITIHYTGKLVDRGTPSLVRMSVTLLFADVLIRPMEAYAHRTLERRDRR